MKDSVAAAATEPGGAQAVPYLVVYELQAAGTAPEVADFEGLRLVHRVHSQALPDYLVTYWLSRDHWRIGDEQFQKTAHAARVTLDGLAGGLKTGAKPLWRRFHVHTWILALAAFLGALDAIGNHYEWLFARPFVLLNLNDYQGLSSVEGSALAASVRVSNQTRIEHKDLRINPVLMPHDGSPDVKLLASPAIISALSPGSSIDVAITGKAPKAGGYDLHIRATGEAGALAPTSEFQLDYPVRIWPISPSVEWTLRSQGSYAQIDARLILGSEAPHGVDCQIYLFPHRSNGKPILDFFDATSETWIPDNNTPGEERESLSWHGPVAGHEKTFRCSIPINSGDDLKLLEKRITVSCSKAEGG